MTASVEPIRPFVLVVDDDELQRREIVRCLSDLGIDTREAVDGGEAVTAMRLYHPPIVIMDIKMPNLDGVEATKALKDIEGYRPKVILTTGDPDSLYRANQMRLDIFGVLEKPLPLRTLSRFVTTAMDQLKTATIKPIPFSR